MLLLLAACNGSDGGPGPGTNDTGPSSTTAIGPDGGTAESADGRFVLVIPPGALSDDVDITIAEQASDGPIGVEWELGPDGLEFAEPARATITMDLDDTTIRDDDGVYTVPAIESVSGDTVEELGGIDITLDEELVLSADVEHFSSIRTAVGDWKVRGFVFPAVDGSLSAFDIGVG